MSISSIIIQLTINSLIAGAIYALAASGFSLIYSTCNFVHFAHGAVIACAAYFLYLFFSILGINFLIALALAIFFTAFLGWLMNWAVYKKLRKRKAGSAILLIASFALLVIAESLILLFFGASVKTIGLIKPAKGIEFFGAIITALQAVIIGVSVVLLAGMFLFIKKTKTGKAMRAVSDNKDAAAISGISSEKIYAQVFILGSAIAGAAGILIALEQNLEPSMGTNLVIKAFAGAVIGGIGSAYGAVFGSFLLGFAENFGIWFLPSGYKDAIAFVILFAFLLLRPRGILGKN